jgi:2-haloacid dehalogenase
MLREEIGETVAILRALRERGTRLFALTNWSAETFPIARARFPFLGWFEDIVVSGEVGMAKPDPRIFALTIRRTGLDPTATLFTDDSPRNIESARASGLHAELFRDPAGLRATLREAGLL